MINGGTVKKNANFLLPLGYISCLQDMTGLRVGTGSQLRVFVAMLV